MYGLLDTNSYITKINIIILLLHYIREYASLKYFKNEGWKTWIQVVKAHISAKTMLGTS